MARHQKLLQRARNNPRDVRFSDLLTLATAAGFESIRQGGTSHRRFLHPTAGVFLNLQPLANGKAKDYQVVQFLKAVDAFALLAEEEEQ